MSDILPTEGVDFETQTQVVVVGAGACGLTAALAACGRGLDVVVLERDRAPTGSTSLSSGFVPAAPTRYQRALGIEDTAEQFLEDIERKTKGQGDAALARLVAGASAETLEWLDDRHGLEWLVLDDFLYPGHTRHRMHAVPEKTGAGLMARLLAAAEREDVPIVTDRRVTGLYADGDRVRGVRAERPDGEHESISCTSVILACNGYGGNPPWSASTSPKWRMRSISVMRAIKATRCSGDESSAPPRGISAAIRAMVRSLIPTAFSSPGP